MKRRANNKASLYGYPDFIKALESGTEIDITKARHKYWREYKAKWRKQKRKEQKELTTSWTVDELKQIDAAARKHEVSKTRFIKASTLAYINKRYIVPDQIEVRRIAQHLALTYNAIEDLVNENVLHLQTGKMILQKIFDLERVVLVSLHNPKSLDQFIVEEVHRNASFKEHLFQLLETAASHDTQKH